ncbi:MAG: thiosulfate oxidation carrier protein SoxY, partial [Pseudomonadota bacterium]
MDLTRRDALGLGSGAVAVAVAGSYLHGSMGVSVAPSALAETSSVDAAIAEFVGDAMVQTGRIQLKTPEIAENGNTVPVSFVVDSPMTEDDYVATVMLFADSNPWPSVAKFNFS